MKTYNEKFYSTLVVIPNIGKFDWSEITQQIYFIPKGRQNYLDFWTLDEKRNTRVEAMRKVGRILNDDNYIGRLEYTQQKAKEYKESIASGQH